MGDLVGFLTDTLYPLTAATFLSLAVLAVVRFARPTIRTNPRFRSALRWLAVAFGLELVLIGVHYVYPIGFADWPAMNEF